MTQFSRAEESMAHTIRLLTLLSLVAVIGCNQHHAFSPKGGMDAGLVCETNKAAGYTRPVDLLFVVDNSGSMRQEQGALRAQIPRLMAAFMTGDLNADGTAEHPPITDLHLGVISTDMGLPDVPGREWLGCGDESERYGDNGTLLTRGSDDPTGGTGGTGGDGGASGGIADCSTWFWSGQESFIEWQRSDSHDDAGDEKESSGVAGSLSCLASLGTSGCGFEQQLEATLKALWPSDSKVNGQTVMLDRPFHGGSTGQGAPLGNNAPFLRNQPGQESIIVVVMLTDEDDCSSHDMSHFTPSVSLPADSPLKDVGVNLRCFHSQQNQHRVARYVDGLKALRPGHEDLVLFVAVAGVPVDLIDRTLDLDDATAVDNYYASVLADERMQEVPDPATELANPNLIPSCVRPILNSEPGEPTEQRAYPPRRIVEVARGFGRNGVIESICQDDFSGVTDTVLKRVFTTLERTSCVK